MSQRFRITYTDPETHEDCVHVGDYEGSPGLIELADGTIVQGKPITAREWAEDAAYAMADKGYYRIEELPS